MRAWLMLAACSAWATACAPPCVDDGLHTKQHGSACQQTTTTTSSTGDTSTTTNTTIDSSTGSTTSSLTGGPSTGTTGDTSSTSSSSSDTGSSTGADHCFNDEFDPDETGLDCGGSCAPCPNNQLCEIDADCQSKACHFNKLCVPPSCDNGMFDDGEGHVDCGLICGRTCSLGTPCASDGDCAEGTCINGIRCALDPVCVTGELEQAFETDYDCGGVCGPTCKFEQWCKVNADCISNACLDGKCENQAQCMNLAQDQGETDIDCGGPCKGCVADQQCVVTADCQVSLSCLGLACN